MHIHILGISGTFMSGLALLARERGFEVSGCDANCYPPVSELLDAKGIRWTEGYEVTPEALSADVIIIGNAIKRGMPVLEFILNEGKPYTSGPAWLAENILPNYRVIAIAGTHGKTTTTAMLATILNHAQLQPGFLIGGVVPHFNTNAHLGSGPWFVIEADEYDSAYFDKRPKFMHYRPEIAILNNLEFDHADIYPNLEAIQQQFHYFLKTIPSKGMVLKPRDDKALNAVIEKGIFSKLESLGLNGQATWRAEVLDDAGSSFRIWHLEESVAEVHWPLIGRFNVENALAAIAASAHAGVNPHIAAKALESFKPVKRRLEVKSNHFDITVYDDFAHHPTAITKTIQALVQSKRHQRIIALLEFASYTMRSGVHGEQMAKALVDVDMVLFLKPEQFDLMPITQQLICPYEIWPTTQALVEAAIKLIKPGDGVLVMSNRGFDNIHQQLTERILAVFGKNLASVSNLKA